MMSESEGGKADPLAKAKKQLAAVADEFGKGLAAVKDPGKRREMTVAYLDVLQKYLAKAQEGVAHAREKRQGADMTTEVRSESGPMPTPPGAPDQLA
jgi:hypothetical protein